MHWCQLVAPPWWVLSGFRIGKVRVQPTDQVCEDLGAAETLNNAQNFL